MKEDFINSGYCSPLKEFDYKTDVWSLGIILYQLITLKTPSPIIKREDILKFIDNSLLEKYYVPIDNIFPGKRLKKIVYKCLKILPHERTEIDAIIKLVQKFKIKKLAK